MIIAAVIVTYHPDLGALNCLVSVVKPQVAFTIVVDNGSDEDIALWMVRNGHEDTRCVALRSNRGVAAAQNAGISVAREAGASHVILFDQDSEPAKDMVSRLADAAVRIEKLGAKVGAVGPRYTDPRLKNPPPFVEIRHFFLRRLPCKSKGDVIPVAYLVSSGLLIPMSALDAVGGMREEFFIDYVDIEWGLRAQAMGLRSFGVCEAEMTHALGEPPVLFMGKSFPVHSPLRHYYHFRNAVWMCCYGDAPRMWKVTNSYRLLLKFTFYSLVTPPRSKHLRMMLLGIWHGIRGRLGPIHEA